jgi:hypothetical protein
MALMIFWIKIGLKRVLEAFKTRPFLMIWGIVFFAFVIYSIAISHIASDIQTAIMGMPFIMLYMLLFSLKRYNLIPTLLTYSKSKFSNNTIGVRFFIKKAIVSNISLFIFNIFLYYTITDRKYFFVIPTATIVLIFSSFFIMYGKYLFINRREAKTTVKMAVGENSGSIVQTHGLKNKFIVNPRIKSAMYDYVTPSILASAAIDIVLFFTAIIQFTEGINHLYEMENQSGFFMLMTVIFSLGFSGIFFSIPNINWKFQAIISPNIFKYYINRTMLFLGVFYGWLFVLFIIFGCFINLLLLLKYLLCIFVLFLVAVFMSFSVVYTIIQELMKYSIFCLIVVLTIWVSAAPAGFLAILIIPVFATFVKAKSEFREWYLL